MNGRVTLSLGQQFDINDPNKNITTIGSNVRVTNDLTARAKEAFSKEGTATTLGVTKNVNDKLSLTTDYTVAQMKTGETANTAAVGAEQRVNDNITTLANVAVTNSSAGSKTTTGSLATKAKIDDNTSLDAVLGKTASSTGDQKTTAAVGSTFSPEKDSSVKTTLALNQDASGNNTNSVIVDATKKVDEKKDISSRVQVDENAESGKTTTVSFTDKNRLNSELQSVSERSFALSPAGTKTGNTYALLREKDGRKLEGSVTRALADEQSAVTQSNIFGLSGDVNDKWALKGTVEKGDVQNLDGTRTNRSAFALASGYVYKDPETTMERLKNSTKIELRLDDGATNTRQFVFYNAVEGRVTDNFSVSAKLEYGRTYDTSTGQDQARHKEIILGAAYRPVNFDNLNLIARYTYKDNQGPSGQIQNTSTDVEQTTMQVLAAEAVYDINENWQLAEKFALRINDEKVQGFEFNRTHTWLMIHRLNYRIDRNWTIGGEYRKLTQMEAKDSKQGILLEATRNINDNMQLGLGWNFTRFNDDLTDLNFTAQGPFLRMTGKLYDRTPEEKARARAKWLDGRITEWSWVMVKKELEKPDSKVVSELNRLFAMAQAAQKAGRYEQAQQIYKDVIMAGQMMFDEAAEYIRTQIAFEEKLQDYNKTAEDYFKTGEYLKARKLWEKIVEDAQKRVLQ